MKDQLIQLYIKHTLEHNKTPENVYLFCKHANISESEFYTQFNSLEALEAEIYNNWFEAVLTKCTANEIWASYSVREKLLAVFYTFFEEAKQNRTFIKFMHDRDIKKLPKWPAYLNKLNESFKREIKTILDEGFSTQELAKRKFLDERYADGVWLNFLFVFKFWVEDNSTNFEQTDAAIEKSVNLALDLMSKSAFDTALDFGKFLFQHAKK